MKPELKKILRPIVVKHAARFADADLDSIFDSEFRTDAQIVREFAEHPVAINNVVNYLAEVQAVTGIKTKPILKSMVKNMGLVKKDFLKEYDAVMKMTGSRELKA